MQVPVPSILMTDIAPFLHDLLLRTVRSNRCALPRTSEIYGDNRPLGIWRANCRVGLAQETSFSDIQNRKVNVFLNAGVMGRFDVLGGNP